MATTARARARAELTREITEEARRQVALEGAQALSLRAIARELGMASSAIYRYFPSRDDLLTRLIIDAYDSIGETAEQADAACARDDFAGRWRASCRAVRAWALGRPHEYALIYGSPVPGYRAPESTIGPATRVTAVLIINLLKEAAPTLAPRPAPPSSPGMAREAKRVAKLLKISIPPELLTRALMAWASVFGLISFELFGHLVGSVEDPGLLFDDAIAILADSMGLA
jgi:AcrR family transcriptional regulator